MLLAFLLWYLRDIVLDVLTAVVIASAMEPAIRFFMRHGLRRLLAVILMYLIVAAAFVVVLVFFMPPVLNDAANFLQQLPQTLSSLNISDVTHGLLPWGSLSQTFSSADLLQNISTTITSTDRRRLHHGVGVLRRCRLVRAHRRVLVLFFSPGDRRR